MSCTTRHLPSECEMNMFQVLFGEVREAVRLGWLGGIKNPSSWIFGLRQKISQLHTLFESISSLSNFLSSRASSFPKSSTHNFHHPPKKVTSSCFPIGIRWFIRKPISSGHKPLRFESRNSWPFRVWNSQIG